MPSDPINATTVCKPYVCPEHPAAQIRHSWDETQYIMNGYPAGRAIKINHTYQCAECGRELRSEL